MVPMGVPRGDAAGGTMMEDTQEPAMQSAGAADCSSSSGAPDEPRRGSMWFRMAQGERATRTERGGEQRGTRARQGRDLLQELSCGRGSSVLLTLGLAAVMLGSAVSIECWIGTYDVFKRPDCDNMLFQKALWDDRCLNKDDGVNCNDYLISDGCPEWGTLPCERDTKRESGVMDGNSKCDLAVNWNVCLRGITACQKIVTENWVGGELKQWNIRAACGNCPFASQVKSTCDPKTCVVDGMIGACPTSCYYMSESRLQTETCYDCEQNRCNLSTRRLAHHSITLLMGALALSLLVRKCRA